MIRYVSDVPNIFHDIFPITKTDSTNILTLKNTIQRGMDVLKWSEEMSVLEGHVSDCSSSPKGWFNGRVSYFGMERYKSLTSFPEISLKYRNRTKLTCIISISIDKYKDNWKCAYVRSKYY